MKVLFIGDICGEYARKTVGIAIAKIRKEENIDVIIANIENSAHGRGSNIKIIEELRSYGVDGMTSGNHIWLGNEYTEFLSNQSYKVIRPLNYPDDIPGVGFIEINNGCGKLLVVNLIGIDLMNERTAIEPFRYFKEFIKENDLSKYDGVLVDFHAETTSEKVAFGKYFDGKVSAILGTHTHIQTADEEILPNGTAYITDVGSVSPYDSVLWTRKDIIINRMMYPYKERFEISEDREIVFNAVIIDIINCHKSKSIKRIYKKFSV